MYIKYKKHYENMIKEYKNNNKNGCNNAKIEFYKNKLKELEKTVHDKNK